MLSATKIISSDILRALVMEVIQLYPTEVVHATSILTVVGELAARSGKGYDINELQ